MTKTKVPPRALLDPKDSDAYDAELAMAKRAVTAALRRVNQDYVAWGEVEKYHQIGLEDARSYLYNRFGVAV